MEQQDKKQVSLVASCCTECLPAGRARGEKNRRCLPNWLGPCDFVAPRGACFSVGTDAQCSLWVLVLTGTSTRNCDKEIKVISLNTHAIFSTLMRGAIFGIESIYDHLTHRTLLEGHHSCLFYYFFTESIGFTPWTSWKIITHSSDFIAHSYISCGCAVKALSPDDSRLKKSSSLSYLLTSTLRRDLLTKRFMCLWTS